MHLGTANNIAIAPRGAEHLSSSTNVSNYMEPNEFKAQFQLLFNSLNHVGKLLLRQLLFESHTKDLNNENSVQMATVIHEHLKNSISSYKLDTRNQSVSSQEEATTPGKWLDNIWNELKNESTRYNNTRSIFETNNDIRYKLTESLPVNKSEVIKYVAQNKLPFEKCVVIIESLGLGSNTITRSQFYLIHNLHIIEKGIRPQTLWCLKDWLTEDNQKSHQQLLFTELWRNSSETTLRKYFNEINVQNLHAGKLSRYFDEITKLISKLIGVIIRNNNQYDIDSIRSEWDESSTISNNKKLLNLIHINNKITGEAIRNNIKKLFTEKPHIEQAIHNRLITLINQQGIQKDQFTDLVNYLTIVLHNRYSCTDVSKKPRKIFKHPTQQNNGIINLSIGELNKLLSATIRTNRTNTLTSGLFYNNPQQSFGELIDDSDNTIVLDPSFIVDQGSKNRLITSRFVQITENSETYYLEYLGVENKYKVLSIDDDNKTLFNSLPNKEVAKCINKLLKAKGLSTIFSNVSENDGNKYASEEEITAFSLYLLHICTNQNTMIDPVARYTTGAKSFLHSLGVRPNYQELVQLKLDLEQDLKQYRYITPKDRVNLANIERGNKLANSNYSSIANYLNFSNSKKKRAPLPAHHQHIQHMSTALRSSKRTSLFITRHNKHQ
ncbi:MAG: hypothetical protein QG673_2075 [Pseudomonadota bacterium]|nr:hypothetical protein [Pseudomonadota bacterium]